MICPVFTSATRQVSRASLSIIPQPEFQVVPLPSSTASSTASDGEASSNEAKPESRHFIEARRASLGKDKNMRLHPETYQLTECKR